MELEVKSKRVCTPAEVRWQIKDTIGIFRVDYFIKCQQSYLHRSMSTVSNPENMYSTRSQMEQNYKRYNFYVISPTSYLNYDIQVCESELSSRPGTTTTSSSNCSSRATAWGNSRIFQTEQFIQYTGSALLGAKELS